MLSKDFLLLIVIFGSMSCCQLWSEKGKQMVHMCNTDYGVYMYTSGLASMCMWVDTHVFTKKYFEWQIFDPA